VDTIDKDLLRRMKQVGCYGLVFGVESGNQEILDTVKKKITLKKVTQAVALTKETGMRAVTSFILGLPGETKKTMRQSYDFAKQLNAPYCLHVLAPFPGTEVREKADEYGITILTDDWSKYDANRAVTTTPGAGAKEVQEILHEYYSDVRRFDRAQEELERQGRLSDEDIEEKRRRRGQRFAWSLLKNDCIENLGPLEIRDGPTKDLALRLAERLSLPVDQAEEQLKDLENEGLLLPGVKDGHAVWSWSAAV
jgi:radical SAM superfamily enzyme YgiQ (UPF0313 family)